MPGTGAGPLSLQYSCTAEWTADHACGTLRAQLLVTPHSALQIRDWGGLVMAHLQQLTPDSVASSQSKGIALILECFGAWVRIGTLQELDAQQTSALTYQAAHLLSSQDGGGWAGHSPCAGCCVCCSLLVVGYAEHRA